ncbi:MAG: hypothetical protein PUA69_03050 [Erysipelotrichaceae bacterium]|jgi:hypothetical protein|nr:hypothetical protein [Erysipelotrichaceae bacterium]
MADKKTKKKQERKEPKQPKSGRETSGRAVIRYLQKKQAVDELHAIGYDELKNVHLSTPVLAYTIANLMEEKVVVRTTDERYYFSQAGWDKLEKKVTAGTSMLFIIPIAAMILFYILSKILG